jgi:protein O-mannosyl-transferase
VRGPRSPWIALAIAGAAILAYQTSFGGVFVFDDRPAIVENTTIRSLAVPDVLIPPPGSTVSGRPVANVSLAFNYAVGGLDPRGYHAVNLAIHIAAALVVFGVARRTLAVMGSDPGLTPSTWLAAAIALIWAVHPLTTSAVTYIVQRVESLMGLFYLLTLYCAIRASAPTARRGLWSALSIACCALGLATKEPMITAPLVVWLWDVTFAQAPWTPWKNRTRRLLYLGLALTWSVTGALLLQQSQSRVVLADIAASGTVEGWTPWFYLWTQAGVIVRYLQLAVVPSQLSIDYYGWPIAASPLAVLPQAIAMVVLFVAGVLALFKRWPAGFAAAWFFLVLAPTSSFIPISSEIAAEHRMYLPLIAVVAVAVVAGHRVFRLLAAPLRRPAAVGTVLAIVGACVFLTRERNRAYWSDESIWADAVSKRPTNARARINYGINLMRTGRFREAESQMRVALDLPSDQPTHARVLLQLGSSLCAQRRLGEGIPLLEQALFLDSTLPDAPAILGQAYLDAGDRLKGVIWLRRGLDRRPDEPEALKTFTWYAATTPGVSQADREFTVVTGERAVRLTNGQDVASLEALGAAYAAQGRFTDALATARRALQLAEARSDGAATGLRRQIQYYESQIK